MRLILVRHGETEENKLSMIQGHLPGKLSAEGIEQAKALAIKLKDMEIDHIYSSDLARSADTAKEIAKFHPNTPLELDKDLRERHYGFLQGQRRSEIDWPHWRELVYTPGWRPDGGETLEEMRDRIVRFIKKAYKTYPNGTIVVVSHGAAEKVFKIIISGMPLEDIGKLHTVENASFQAYEIDHAL